MIKISFPDAWCETALVAVTRFAASPSDIEFMTITETIDVSEGDYPGESVKNLAGGRLWKQSPEEDGEITLELYPIELDTTSGVGLFQQWVGVSGGTAYDTTEPLATDVSWTTGSRYRDRFRVTVLWTNDPAATTANGATAASTDSLRFSAMGCRITSHKVAFTDGIVKATVTFKWPAFNRAGTVRMSRWDSGDNTALGALAAYDDEDSWS